MRNKTRSRQSSEGDSQSCGDQGHPQLSDEGWFSALFDSVMDGVIVLDEQQQIVRWNNAAEIIFRCPAAEVLGQSIDRFIPQSLRSTHRKDIQSFGESNITRRHMGQVALTGVRADGQEFPAEITISQFERGTQKFFAAIVRDVTERETIERALRESEIRYRTLAEAAHDMIWIIDAKGEILYVNGYAAQQFGRSPSEFAGKYVKDLFPPEVAERQMGNVLKVIETGLPVYVEALNPFPGRMTWLGTSIAPLRGEDGEIHITLGVARDITARKEAELALQRHDAILEAVSFAAESFLQTVDWRENIQEVLARLGTAARVSRVYIFKNEVTKQGEILASQRFEWVSGGVEPQIGNPELQNFSLSAAGGGRWLEFLSKNQPLYARVNDVPPPERELLEAQGILSIAVVPIFFEQVFWGFMGYDECQTPREWTLMELQALKTAADILGAAIQRRRAEEILRISEVEYRSLFEHALEGIYRASPDGRILAANPALIRMLGCDSPEELLTMDFVQDLYQRPGNRDVVGRVMADADELRNVELQLRRKDGRPIFVLNSSRTIRDSNGRVLYYEGMIVDITERKQATEQIRRRVTELEALYESGLALSQTLEPKAIGAGVIKALTRRLDWVYAAVHLRQENGDGIELLAFSSGPSQSLDIPFEARSATTHIGQGLAGSVIQCGRPARVGNLDREKRYAPLFPGMKSGIYIPIKIGARTIGCISVESPESDAFDESDERLVSTLGTQTAIALENARLFGQIKRRLDQVSVLHQIDMAISSSADFHSILKFVLEHILMQLKVDAANVLLFDPIMMSLDNVAGVGFRIEERPSHTLTLAESVAGKAILERRPIHIPDLRQAGGEMFRHGMLADEDFLSYSCMPLIAKGEIQGALEVFSRQPLNPDDDWMEFFQVLAGQAAVAIDNRLMFEDLQRSHLELSLAYDATIEGWSRALDLRDRETEGHTQRVTDLTVRLARKLGLSEVDIVHIRRGGLLHDIGKMGVSDTILNKPGPLTEEEFNIMRQHPKYAYDMLIPITYLRPALDIPYSHHERWDGTGYPLGLKGDAIPLAARIFAVADVYDALTSDRPYRKALSKEKALQYLRRESGKHFDPLIVAAFLTIIEEKS